MGRSRAFLFHNSHSAGAIGHEPKGWARSLRIDRLKDLPLVERERALALAAMRKTSSVRGLLSRMTTARARILNFLKAGARFGHHRRTVETQWASADRHACWTLPASSARSRRPAWVQVFEAERARSIQQRAAVKIIRRGQETGFNLDRFRRDGSSGRSESPTSRALFDGGATADGAPYFVWSTSKANTSMNTASPDSCAQRACRHLPGRLPRRQLRPSAPRSSIATSSPAIFSSRPTASSNCWTSGSPRPRSATPTAHHDRAYGESVL